MSSNGAEDQSPSSACGGNPSPKGKGTGGSGATENKPSIDQLSHVMADTSTETEQEGGWDVIAMKSKKQDGGNVAKQWASSSCDPKSWRHPKAESKMDMTTNGRLGKPYGSNWEQAVDSIREMGRGYSELQSPGKDWESAYTAPPEAVVPPLQGGWQLPARNSSSSCKPNTSEDARNQNGMRTGVVLEEGSSGEHDFGSKTAPVQSDDCSDSNEFLGYTDDELSDEYDSDVSERSFETRKKNKWFRVFFEVLDTLSVDQINEPTRQWHCPACQGGHGAIDWYRGLQSLMTHGKTKGSKRVNLHRELVELLEEELQRRGISVIVAGEAFGRWKGLSETTADHDIVWPPMVVIMNTILEQDENDKWIGMGSQELLEYFQPYAAVKARHSYGPDGHRGISVLIFEASAIGYMEAEHLHRHFADEGIDREAWEHHRVLFYPGGKRQLYGFLARKDDIDYFNQHSNGKSRLKFEIRSYREMVMDPMKQMREDNRQLVQLRRKIAEQQQHSKAEESFPVVSQNLCETVEENMIIRLRAKMWLKESKEEVDLQRRFSKEQMDKLRKTIEEKEIALEKWLQQEHANAGRYDANTGTGDTQRLREVESAGIIDNQVKKVEDILAERGKLLRAREDKMMELMKDFDDGLTELLKYAPGTLRHL